MRRTILPTVVLILVSLASLSSAVAGKRVALVVGNSVYEHVGALSNPANDSNDMSTALRALGFEVIEGHDLKRTDLVTLVRRFTEALAGADAGLFFYAGHGFQVGGVNYLIPTDAKLVRESDLAFEAIRLDLVLEQLERETGTALIFLDACRDNPMAQVLARSMGARSASIGRGLARVDSGIGTFIAFSTQPGNVALDGKGRNSPFTGALVKHISEPGMDLSAIMIAVRNDVYTATNGKQVPWDSSSLRRRFFFRLDGSVASETVAAMARPDFSAEAVAVSKEGAVAEGETIDDHRITTVPKADSSLALANGSNQGTGDRSEQPKSAFGMGSVSILDSPLGAFPSQAPVPEARGGHESPAYSVLVGSKSNQMDALATFADMQQKYRSLLANYHPMVQKANLGAKGIWYRLLIGPIPDSDTAAELCRQLKAQSHPDCLVMGTQRPVSPFNAKDDWVSPATGVDEATWWTDTSKLKISEIRRPYMGVWPEKFDVVVANFGSQTIREITIGYRRSDSSQPCSSALSSYDGFKKFWTTLRGGDSVTLQGDFSAQAKRFCIISARPQS